MDNSYAKEEIKLSLLSLDYPGIAARIIEQVFSDLEADDFRPTGLVNQRMARVLLDRREEVVAASFEALNVNEDFQMAAKRAIALLGNMGDPAQMILEALDEADFANQVMNHLCRALGFPEEMRLSDEPAQYQPN